MPKETIPIASDHAGFELKEKLEAQLKAMGYDVEDLGTQSGDSTDYADYAHPLAERVASGAARRGVLMCGTGLGMSYAANRHAHVRAAVAWSPEVAALARQHNDANVLAIGARTTPVDDIPKIVRAWFSTEFEGGRHAARVAKISEVEQSNS